MSVLKFHIYIKQSFCRYLFLLFLNSICIDRHWVTLLAEDWLQIKSKFTFQFMFGEKKSPFPLGTGAGPEGTVMLHHIWSGNFLFKN